MKRIITFIACLLLFAASTCVAQMYTVIDLNTLGGGSTVALGINSSGQVTGYSERSDLTSHAFRTAANSPINPATDDLDLPFSVVWSEGTAINDSGQVVGRFDPNYRGPHAFRTAANSPINPATDNLDPTEEEFSYGYAHGINASGQAVGFSNSYMYPAPDHAFRTAANSPVNPITDDLGTLGGTEGLAFGINASGQVVGRAQLPSGNFHAFQTVANSPINPATDDLGTLGGTYSTAMAVNASGQVVGSAYTAGDALFHAFRTVANNPINPATDDLGTLGGETVVALGIDSFGQVVGTSSVSDVVIHGFLYSGGVMHDLNNLIPSGSALELIEAFGINDTGEIIANSWYTGGERAFLLIPIYKAFVQKPINADGSSVFNAKRGVVPVKFTLNQYDVPSCSLSPATISVTRTAGGTFGPIDESTYITNADDSSNFRIDSCQYVYNLAASSLGVGTYRVDISINGIMVGHAVFALK